MFQRAINRISLSYSVGSKAFGVGSLLLTSPALAETSVKVLYVPGMWLQAFLIGGIAVLAGRFRWWLGLPFVILPIVVALSTSWLKDQSGMGPAIVEEHGECYFPHFYASAMFAVALVGIGIWMGWRRRNWSLTDQ